MTRFKILKGVMLGLCISLLSTGAAFASESSGEQSSSVEGSITSEDRDSIEQANASDSNQEKPEPTTMVDEPTPDSPVSNEEGERYVGDDMVLEDGEFGITSVTDDEERYVGDDLILEEGEMGIVSIEEGVLEEDPTKMAETGMVNNTGTQSNLSNLNMTVLVVVISVVFLGILATSILMLQKRKRSN